MSKSESGRLGAIKSAETARKKKEIRIAKYLENPSLCRNCVSVIPYDKRKNKFCSKNCSATYNNTTREAKNHHNVYKCTYCGSDVKRSRTFTGAVFCNNKCQNAHNKDVSIQNWLLTGENIPGKKTLKEWLLKEQDNKCNNCGIPPMWDNKPLVFDLEHKDGNSENNHRDNLELLCPNCHSQTATFKGRNRGNGRYARRKRYSDGLSF